MNEPDIICASLLESYSLIVDLPDNLSMQNMKKLGEIRRAYYFMLPHSEKHTMKMLEELRE